MTVDRSDTIGLRGGAQAIMDRHARSFAPATRLMERADRQRIARLYALCRTVDDLADCDGSPAAQARLAAIEQDLRKERPADPVAREAITLFADKPRAQRAFGALVAGVHGDTGPVLIPDMARLDAYAHAVAGTVGIMVAELFEVPHTRQGPAADLGKAMQLTNICRDVGEDARAGRRYLPGTLCRYPPAALLNPGPETRADAEQAIATLLAKADALYASGFAGLDALPPRPRAAVVVAAALYRGIGVEIGEGRADPLTTRARVPRRRKADLALRALVGRTGPRIPSKRRAHVAHA